jgi:hypothetical protein
LADDETRSNEPRRSGPRFHGRLDTGQPCAQPGCAAPGEFRAPAGPRGRSGDGPPAWRYLCLEHVREFNTGYNFFAGMDTDEITEAQRPYAGWERETRAFASTGADQPPRWAGFTDPLDAIGARFRERMAEAAAQQAPRKDGKALSRSDRDSLRVLELGVDADRRALRQRYSELVRRYHPDRNGGDRSHEAALQKVIAAYQQLRGSAAFA